MSVWEAMMASYSSYFRKLLIVSYVKDVDVIGFLVL